MAPHNRTASTSGKHHQLNSILLLLGTPRRHGRLLLAVPRSGDGATSTMFGWQNLLVGPPPALRLWWTWRVDAKQQGSIQQAKWEDAISSTTTQAMVARSGQTEAAASSSRARSTGVPLLLAPDSALPSRPVDRINSGVGFCSETFFQNNETDLLFSIWMVFHSLLSGWIAAKQHGVHTTSEVGGYHLLQY